MIMIIAIGWPVIFHPNNTVVTMPLSDDKIIPAAHFINMDQL